ncbi:MAG TPA: efflux transporter outer membrane subunit [Thermoguttaceae bacterium]|nr:efflux transporter outer membrane subunit [Thermoguttaceae bacterium]
MPRPALRALGVALALALLATGCTTGPGEWIRNGFKVGPNYCRPRAPVADQWIDTEDPHVQAQAADYGHWWGVFDDPVLNELVEAAYEQNLPLKIAGMRILEARAQLGRATGDLFPQRQEMFGVFARNELSHNSYPFGQFPLPKWEYDFWSLGLGNSLSPVSWELDFWGRFRRGIESAEANMNAQIESYDDALVILQAEVAATYIQVRTLEERLALARQNVELQKNTLRITQDRFDQGVVSELDVQQARSVLGATESLIPVLQMGRRKAQNRLCTLMGMPPRDLEAELGGPGATPTTPPEVAVGIPAELLRRRPDVRRAEREAAAQCARIGIAESELYPHFSISGYIAFDAENFADVFDWDSIAGHVGPSFRWNILNYGRILNDVRVQEARFSQAVLNYQETVLRANEEAENAITFYLREQARVKSLDQSTAATARAVELANIQYEQGLIDFQRVLDSQRALVLQQDTLAESRGNVALNLIGLYKALGGGWEMRLEPNLALASVPAETPFEEEPLPAELAPMPPPLPAPGDGTAEAP